MSCHHEGHSPENPCNACKEALIDRALDTKEGTRALFDAAKLTLPDPIADTKIERMAQFYIAAGINLAPLIRYGHTVKEPPKEGIFGTTRLRAWRAARDIKRWLADRIAPRSP